PGPGRPACAEFSRQDLAGRDRTIGGAGPSAGIHGRRNRAGADSRARRHSAGRAERSRPIWPLTAGAMTLEQVLRGGPLRTELSGSLPGTEVRGLEYASRRVEAGFLFFAFPGSRTDGREFAQSAIEKGAVAVASELPAPAGFRGTWIEAERGRRALALAA